jgi:tRNA nucleotidyltransferase/poly(A) polymerase
MQFATQELKMLRAAFKSRGFDIRLVGGAVRDMLMGETPKDMDFCTDATPDEQVEIYNAHGYKFVATGLQHGTITVVIDHVGYEITSLRTETDHDGRHATVAYTRDWMEDLKRRDFTFNAMAMTFGGDVVDPFGGQDDLRNQIVRFVGNADDRVKEDYLRILRWFRFQARFGKQGNIDPAAWTAILNNYKGLKQISRERVWSELKKIVVHPRGSALFAMMHEVGMGEYISTNVDSFGSRRIDRAESALAWSQDPEVIMAAWMAWDFTSVSELAFKLKWSNEERAHALWLCNHAYNSCDLRRLIAVDGAPRAWVAELAKLEGRDAWSQNALVHWEFSPFPVTGTDLIAAGMKPGKDMGKTIAVMKSVWADSGYVATKDDLMKMVSA